MIVGETMGGKTSAYKVLAAALADLNASGLLEEFKVRREEEWGRGKDRKSVV